MEALLDQFVAEHFHRFSPETLRALAAALDALPGRGSVADAIEPEKQRFVASELRLLVQLRAELSGDDQAVIVQFRERKLREAEASGDWESLDRITAKTDKLIAEAGGTAEGLQRALEEVVARHTAVEALLRMPPLAYLERSTQLLVELESESNPMVRTLGRIAIAVRNVDLVIEVRWRMLHAAIQHRLGEPSALEKSQDPAGTGPFTMRRVVLDGVDRGFALESALRVRGFKETLVFVERPGSPIIVSGPRAGELRPRPVDTETRMRERYGIKPSGEP